MKKRLLCVVGIAVFLTGGAVASDRVAELAKLPATLENGAKLMALLDDPEPKVRLETVKAWRAYAEPLRFEIGQDTREKIADGVLPKDDQTASLAWRREIEDKLAAMVGGEDKELGFEALRTLSLFADSIRRLQPFELWIENLKPSLDDRLCYETIQRLEAKGQIDWEKLAGSKDAQDLHGALYSLKREQLKSHEPLLRSLLAKPDAMLRAVGLYELFRMGASDANELFYQKGLRDPSADVRQMADLLGDFSAIQLKAVVESPTQWPAASRVLALDRLYGRAPDDEKYCARYLTDPSPKIRAIAIHAVNEYYGFHRPDSFQRLLEKSAKDSDPDVRLAAYHILMLTEDANRDKWIEAAFKDPDQWIRGDAAGAEADADRFAKNILQAFGEGTIDNWQVLIDFDKPAYRPYLAECLTSKNERLRLHAATDRAGHGDESVLPILEGLVRSTDRSTWCFALERIVKFDTDASFASLVRFLNPADPDRFVQSAWLLAGYYPEKAVALLRPFVKHANRTIRLAAKEGIRDAVSQRELSA